MKASLLLLAAALAGASTPPPGTAARSAPLVTGLDHVPVAVRDLDAAAETYERLGFSLKPGRPHPNGMKNRHVKLRDGTQIELITAPEARDALTAEYRRHLEKGEGPAFVGLYAPDRDAVTLLLDRLSLPHRRQGGLLVFPDGSPLRYLFFGGRNASPTDRPEHLRHANGAESLEGVWLAGDDLSRERALLAGLGVSIVEEEVHVPRRTRALVARLPEGEVVLLPGERQVAPGRRIAGLTVRTRSLDAALGALSRAGGPAPAVVRTERGTSVFLPPGLAHGTWLELREERPGAARRRGSS
ncbi:MAG: VOC family protein [Acidobacteria bacterium]|nr:MAG: VOC family protein [Acidobacteriota bacterium]